MKSYSISFLEVNALAHAVNHYPDGVPKRWTLVSECVEKFIKEKHEEGKDIKFVIGNRKQNLPVLFKSSAAHCKEATRILKNSCPQFLECNYQHWMKRSFDSAPTGHKPIILLPGVSECMECQKTTNVRSRCSFPVVFTDTGPEVAASYSSYCSTCHITYYHSFFEVNEFVKSKRIYYPTCLEHEYLATSLLTVFEVSYLKRLDEEVCKGCISFETCSHLYNSVHKDKILACEKKFPELIRKNISAKLQDQRLEEGWFFYTLLSYFSVKNMITTVDFEIGSNGKRRNLEAVCEIAIDEMRTSNNEWLNHRCDIRGCKEGYVSIDGNEKVRRPMCAAPNRNIKLSKCMANVIQCCPNSPVTGGKHATPSKYCAGHEGLSEKKRKADDADRNGEKIVLTINLKDVRCVSTRIIEYCKELPRNDDNSVLTGCKTAGKVDRFYNRTAGVMCMVRPCGYIADFTEMFTCESCSQVFAFLLRTCLQDNSNVNFIGYDRACELVPFLENLSKKGNVGADILLNGRQYLVDLFHCVKHKKKTCMPLENNPACCFHPKLAKFADIHGVNTQCAEQTFKWLNKFKLNTRRMTQFKFKFYIWHVINKRNEFLDEQSADSM